MGKLQSQNGHRCGCLLLLFCMGCMALQLPALQVQAQASKVPILTRSTGQQALSMQLVHRYQRYSAATRQAADQYNPHVNSPKSVNFSPDSTKFYIQSLEGHETIVVNARTLQPIKVISHTFGPAHRHLFKNDESTVFDYPYTVAAKNVNHFSGKPVESCFSHGGRYLWVTYYRRSFDANAACPSALAIIDTEHDSIVRVMPTGPLPKMIACSPDNKYIAVTHWGDNTVGLIDISGPGPMDFAYVRHAIIDHKLAMNFGGQKVNRDALCGHCLRGTVFTPDSKFLLVGKMGGSGGIAVLDMETFDYLGTVSGMKTNVRHLAIAGDYLYLSANGPGYVQRMDWRQLVKERIQQQPNTIFLTQWETTYVGPGARTIALSADGSYLFAAVNVASKIVAVRTADMQVVAEIRADSYPVGMDLSQDNRLLVVTAQGKGGNGGNSVMVYKVDYGPGAAPVEGR